MLPFSTGQENLVRDAQVGTRLVPDGLAGHRLPAGRAERVKDAGGERGGDRVSGARVPAATERSIVPLTGREMTSFAAGPRQTRRMR